MKKITFYLEKYGYILGILFLGTKIFFLGIFGGVFPCYSYISCFSGIREIINQLDGIGGAVFLTISLPEIVLILLSLLRKTNNPYFTMALAGTLVEIIWFLYHFVHVIILLH